MELGNSDSDKKFCYHHIKKISRVVKAFFLTGNTIKKSLQRMLMASNGVWATEVEIFRTVHLLKTDIYVYSSTGHSQSLNNFSGRILNSSIMWETSLFSSTM